jgi:transposase
MSGKTVQLTLHVRRFRCQNQQCQRKTFVERVPDVVSLHAQRTTRLIATLALFAVALSGQAGSRLLTQVGMALSSATLLRLAKQMEVPSVVTPRVLGVDDFAFRRGRTYGTILVNLETHRPIDLLPQRTAEALAHWLREHPGVQIISRDRSTEYARGASEGAPLAQQVADRWHLLKNLREAVERALKRVHAGLLEKQAAQREQFAPRYKRRRSQTEIAASRVARVRRQARYAEAVSLYTQGVSILEIADQLRLSRTTVRSFVYAGAFPERATTMRAKSMLAPYVPYLEQRVKQGCRKAMQLWREICEQGYTGSYKLVNRWLEPRRETPGRKHSLREKDLLGLTLDEERSQDEHQAGEEPAKHEKQSEGSQMENVLEAPRHLVWLFIRESSQLDAKEQRTLDFLRQDQNVEQMYQLTQKCRKMFRERDAAALDAWLVQCSACGIPDMETFAQGMQKDYAAIKAALTLPFSNGPVEGHVNRLKFVKRSMYGKGSFELLRQRVLQAS